MLWVGSHADTEAEMTDDFNPGTIDVLRAEARTEARLMEAKLPPKPHAQAERWPSFGTFARRLALLVIAIVLSGWLLTLLNSR
jgi:hypothetical protein